MKCEFFDKFSKNIQILNFIQIRPVGAELFLVDRQMGGQAYGRTDRHDKANNHFLQFYEHV
jgi:hypothetical protein